MTKTAIGIMALVIHLIICILIWSGIRTGFLKAKLLHAVSCRICTSLGTGVCPAHTFSAFFRYEPGENSGS